MRKPTNETTDSSIADVLKSRYGSESRRSFVSRLTRFVFGAAGVTIASRAFVQQRPAFAAGPAWDQCGLKGYLCGTGNCTSKGATSGSSWSKCCKEPTCNVWVYCSYYDFCGAAAPVPAQAGCDGGIPANTPSWCGAAPNNVYWCTSISCGSGNYPTEAACSANLQDTCAWLTGTKVAGGFCYAVPDPRSTTGYYCVGTTDEATVP